MARRPPETVANPARGVALVVVAVLVGLLLLRSGLDSSSTSAGTNAGTKTDQGSDSGDGGTDDGTTSTTEALAREPGQVKVIVLNGSGVGGAAKRFSAVLQNVGYDLTNPDGDNSTLKPATTEVLYAEGYQAEASAVAALLSAPATGVKPLGTQTPGNTAGAQVVVILAIDRANDQTPETPG